MVNVSKNKLKTKVAQDIRKQFIATISHFDKESAAVFFEEFFTRSEQLLFAKRLAILYLLREGFPAHRIAQLLKVSTSTIWKLDTQFSHLEKEVVVTACEKFDTEGGLLKELKSLLIDGMSMDPKRRAKWLTYFENRYE